MALKTYIGDSLGSGQELRVSAEGAVGVEIHPHPPLLDTTPIAPFRQFFTDTGFDGGDEDMRVDGSTTNQEFCVKAAQDVDIYIKSISVVISDSGAVLNEFGNIGALTNGCRLLWITDDLGTTVVGDDLISNFEFLRVSGFQPAFGDGLNAFRASNVSGTSEGYIPVIDLGEAFGSAWGLRLRKGSNDKMCFIIRDDVQGVDRFEAYASGQKF